MELRDLRMIPLRSLPLLIKAPTKDTVQVVDMYFSDFTALWESLEVLIRDLEEDVPDAREAALASESFPQDREFVIKHHSLFYNMALLLICALRFLFAFCFRPSNDRNFIKVREGVEQTFHNTGSSNQQFRRGGGTEKRSLEDLDDEQSYFNRYGDPPTRNLDHPPLNQVKDVLKLLYTRIKIEQFITSIPDTQPEPAPYSINSILGKYPFLSILNPRTTKASNQDTPSMEIELLHYAALSVQIMSLGVQAYAQAYTGKLEFSFIDRGISKVILRGGGLITKVATAELEQLTCFGNVTKSPVLVFNIGDLDSPNVSNGQESAPCDIISSLDNIANIWGGK